MEDGKMIIGDGVKTGGTDYHVGTDNCNDAAKRIMNFEK